MPHSTPRRSDVPLTLTEVKRRQRRLRPLLLAVWTLWVAGNFAAIAVVRPLMLDRSEWLGFLLVPYIVGTAYAVFRVWARLNQWFGLYCGACGANFWYASLQEGDADRDSWCRCGAKVIDLGA